MHLSAAIATADGWEPTQQARPLADVRECEPLRDVAGGGAPHLAAGTKLVGPTAHRRYRMADRLRAHWRRRVRRGRATHPRHHVVRARRRPSTGETGSTRTACR